MYRNACRCLTETKSEPKFSENKMNAYDICVDKFVKLLNSRKQKDKDDRPFDDLVSSLEVIESLKVKRHFLNFF